MAKIYKANGEVLDIEPKNGNDLIIFNDEGKLMELPYNENATEIYQERVYEGDFLVGDVLICKNSEML